MPSFINGVCAPILDVDDEMMMEMMTMMTMMTVVMVMTVMVMVMMIVVMVMMIVVTTTTTTTATTTISSFGCYHKLWRCLTHMGNQCAHGASPCISGFHATLGLQFWTWCSE